MRKHYLPAPRSPYLPVSLKCGIIFRYCFAFLLFIQSATGFGQKYALDSLLKEQIYPLNYKGGQLSGSGAILLDTAMQHVPFVAFGEWHNRRAIHQFGESFFRLLHDKHGFNYLALEEDPYLGMMLSEEIRNAKAADPAFEVARRYPNAFHLLTEEELAMISAVGKMSSAKKSPVWGLNQVFGASHIYARLVELAPDKEARKVAQDHLNQALEYERERHRLGKSYMAEVARPEDFTRIRTAFKPKAGSEADFLIYQLALSNRVFAPYVAVPKASPAAFYKSNFDRETNMKHLFADRYKEAQKKEKEPKVLAMFGQLHLYRGRSESTELHTLGNFLSELAIFNKKKSFQVFSVVDLPSVRNSWQAPLLEVADKIADKNAEAVLIDLRPLVPLARKASFKMEPEMRRLILSFDVYLLLRDNTAGSVERLKTPEFKWYSKD